MRADQGFTLIEVLVALAVFGIAALALLKVQGENVRAAGALQERTIAGIVAENRLIETVLSVAAPQTGSQQGETAMAGTIWTWSETVAPTADPDLLRIDIDVRGSDRRSVLASLTGFRGLK